MLCLGDTATLESFCLALEIPPTWYQIAKRQGEINEAAHRHRADRLKEMFDLFAMHYLLFSGCINRYNETLFYKWSMKQHNACMVDGLETCGFGDADRCDCTIPTWAQISSCVYCNVHNKPTLPKNKSLCKPRWAEALQNLQAP